MLICVSALLDGYKLRIIHPNILQVFEFSFISVLLSYPKLLPLLRSVVISRYAVI